MGSSVHIDSAYCVVPLEQDVHDIRRLNDLERMIKRIQPRGPPWQTMNFTRIQVLPPAIPHPHSSQTRGVLGYGPLPYLLVLVRCPRRHVWFRVGQTIAGIRIPGPGTTGHTPRRREIWDGGFVCFRLLSRLRGSGNGHAKCYQSRENHIQNEATETSCHIMDLSVKAVIDYKANRV